MTVSVVTLAERPDLFDAMWSMPDSWPDFMLQDPLSSFTYRPDVLTRVADHVVIALDGDEVVGKGAVRRCAARAGVPEVIVPVRPTGPIDPEVPMSEYASHVRDDGLPVDPWLRVHVRAGGRIAGVAPRSMVISGTLDEWRRWTGLPFDRSGAVEVPGALTPVLCDSVHGTAVYVEPNVWVRHRAAAAG